MSDAGWNWVIQAVEPATNRADAEAMLEAVRHQDGFIAGRVIGDGVIKTYACQAFFDDAPNCDGWLPDGMKRVFTPPWLLQ